MDQSDIRAAQRGDIDARDRIAEWLYDELQRALRVFPYHQRLDLVQDTLLGVFAKLAHGPEEPAAFRYWALAFAANEAKAALREYRRDETRAAKLLAQGSIPLKSSGSVSRRFARRERLALLMGCVDRLPKKYQQAVMHRINGGDHRQLSEQEQISQENARQRFWKGRRLVRQMYRELRVSPVRYRSPAA